MALLFSLGFSFPLGFCCISYLRSPEGFTMSLFVSTKPVSVTIGNIEVTLNVFTELSVGRAIAAQAREGSEDFFEQGIGLLLSYVESWSEPEPFEEATLRRLSLTAFEALVVAVSDAIAPAEDPDQDPEAVSPN